MCVLRRVGLGSCADPSPWPELGGAGARGALRGAQIPRGRWVPAHPPAPTLNLHQGHRLGIWKIAFLAFVTSWRAHMLCPETIPWHTGMSVLVTWSLSCLEVTFQRQSCGYRVVCAAGWCAGFVLCVLMRMVFSCNPKRSMLAH